MTQFEKLQERVKEAVNALPYALGEEQISRLHREMDAIRDYRRAELLNAVADIAAESSTSENWIELISHEGYCVSYVCWMLGISDFNPFDHPGLYSEDYALNTFKKESSITFAVNDRGTVVDIINRIFGSRVQKKFSFQYNVAAENTEEYQELSINVRQSLGKLKPSGLIYMLEKAIRVNSDPGFSVCGIPMDDAATYALINDLDLMGLFGYYVPAGLIEALRKIRPSSFNELCDAYAIGERDLLEIDAYVYNRDGSVTEYTGVKDADEILRSTWGIMLYPRQAREIKKLVPDLDPNDIRKVEPYADEGHWKQRCGVYTIMVDFYRRAYMKAHFPEIFRQVLIACSYN